MTDWDTRWLELAEHVAGWSKDRSTKVGAVIVGDHKQVLAIGYNGFPRGVNDDWETRHKRPAKYMWTEHAERNAIYNAARHGITLDGASLYVPWHPCAACARAIIQSGIRLLVHGPTSRELMKRWGDEIFVAAEMLHEADVETRLVC